MKPSTDQTASSMPDATRSALTGIPEPASIDHASLPDRGRSDSDHRDPRDPRDDEAASEPMLLTLNEVAVELRCARRSVERRIAAREIRTVRFGRCVRVERAELARFIAGHIERYQEADDATTA